MSEPLTEEQLATIRANSKNLWVPGDWNDAAEDVRVLLIEIEQLKAERNTLASWIGISKKTVKMFAEYMQSTRGANDGTDDRRSAT